MVLMLPASVLYYHLVHRREDPTLPKSWFEALRYLHGIELWPLVKSLTWLALIFAVGDYLWYVALGHTSVALGSCVYNSQCVFAYLLSIPLLNESVNLTKVGGVTIALAGVGLVSWASYSSSGGNAGGHTFTTAEQLAACMCALLSALTYALFEVLFSKYATKSDAANVVNTCTGILGLVSLLLGWPFLIAVNYLPRAGGTSNGSLTQTAGWEGEGAVGNLAGSEADFGWGWFSEPFEWPTGSEGLLLAANAALALLFNAFFMLALAFTSPVIVATAGMVAIPCCALADFILHGYTFGGLEIAGFLLILLGFTLLTCGGAGEEEEAFLEAFIASTTNVSVIPGFSLIDEEVETRGGGRVERVQNPLLGGPATRPESRAL